MLRRHIVRRILRHPEPARPFVVGVDLGQVHDFTAIAVLERRKNWSASEAEHDFEFEQETQPRRKFNYHVRFLDRAPLGTSYPLIAERVADLVLSPSLQDRCDLVVDATGVGRPIVDLLRQRALNPIAVTITSGTALTGRRFNIHLPKQDVIAHLQVLFQSGRLKIAANLPLARTLTEELQQYRMRISAAGREQFGVWREGEHDDLLFAVAIAAWHAHRIERRRPAPLVRVSLL